MRLEFIDKIKENDVLGKSILTSDGKILLRAGVILTGTYIKKLKSLGVFYIFVEHHRLDDVPSENLALIKLKQNAMKSMSRVYRNVSVNNNDINDSIRSVEELVQNLMETDFIGEGLYDIRTYDNYTFVHSLDTCIMATVLGLSLKYNESKLVDIGISSVLHDIGKTKVPIKIINKKGPLTKEEFIEVKKHPIYGAEILKKNIHISDKVIDGVMQHHERVDGNGYPYGLSERKIGSIGKIICVCDTYDAISNDRVYRKKFSPVDAYELIMAGSGTIFDQKVVSEFKKSFSIYPLGSCLKLSSGVEGYVIRQNVNFPDRPILRVLYDYRTREPLPSYEIDLIKNPSLTVIKMV